MGKKLKKITLIIIIVSLMLSIVSPGKNLAAANVQKVDQTMYYVVQPGDTLWGLSKEHSLDQGLLAFINGLSEETKLQIGQVLEIPIDNLITHEVQKDETVWRIAHNYHVDWQLIMRENEMTDPRELMTGQKVVIPIPAARVALSNWPKRESWSFRFWPVMGWVSSLFGIRDGRMHEGLDIAAAEGTPIHSVKSGIVEFAGYRGTYGNAVIIRHNNSLKTLYAHASKVLVTKGETVEEGQAIALVGNTGRSTGPHVHFEVMAGTRPIDPSKCLPARQR